MRSTHIIIGLAGHVDHGKTMLTAALTGINTDRLPEEKRRGMTIVPGFVALDLKSGRRLGLIDVPGHERFVKNMLAGVGGMDMALLVIAADEGVMPQTVEHLHILQLLGIKRGVVAITKCDMVEGDWLELVHEQVRELLATSSLKDAPLISVSAHTGEGIDELKDLLDKVAGEVPEKPSSGLCRMPIDRVFTKQGFGTIVTGTLRSGSIVVGQHLELLPGEREMRVRGLQIHDEAVELALAGQRTAINLASSDVELIMPGCWLAEPGFLRESHRLDVNLELLTDAHTLKHNGRVRVYHGTAEVIGRVRLLDRETLEPGQCCLCQLELETPLAPLRGDRLILRSFSPVITIAGASVLDTAPPRYRRSDPRTMATITRESTSDTKETLLAVLRERGNLMAVPALSKTAQLSTAEAFAALKALCEVSLAGMVMVDGVEHYYCLESDRHRRGEVSEALNAFHARYPLRRGLPAAEIRQRIFPSLTARQFSAMLGVYSASGLIKTDGSLIARADFIPTPTPRQQLILDALYKAYTDNSFSPPDWGALTIAKKIPPSDAAEYLLWLVENNSIVRVGDLIFATSAVNNAEKILRENFAVFTMAEARNALGSSRKYMQTLLEYFDERKITVRDGDARRFLDK